MIREDVMALGEVLARALVGEGYTADDVGPALTCGEAEDAARVLRALRQPEAADRLIAGHAAGDDEGDQHWKVQA